jgi:predicted HAD superfamily Cof-like phosphohydrolase
MGQPTEISEVSKMAQEGHLKTNAPVTGWVQDIADMHTKFSVNSVVRKLSSENLRKFLQFRISFLQEELDELNDALNNDYFEKDRADEAVDALIDLCVVAIGTLNAFDIDADEAWNRVHTKNMEKNAGVNPTRPNELGFPDMVKPNGWTPPTHLDNVGLFGKVFNES